MSRPVGVALPRRSPAAQLVWAQGSIPASGVNLHTGFPSEQRSIRKMKPQMIQYGCRLVISPPVQK